MHIRESKRSGPGRIAAILGGGINGLTCGLALQQAGVSTRIITSDVWRNRADNPFFASLYPASSVKPVTVKTPILNELLRISQSRFTEMLRIPGAGIRRHRHFEVHETPEDIPSYAPEMTNFRQFADSGSEEIPRRGKYIATTGWSYDVLFADTPVYMPWLQAKYLESGGDISIKTLSKDDIYKLPEQIIINCTGTGAVGLFDDDDRTDIRFVKGHQIIIQAPDIPEEYRYPGFSYNYTAGSQHYRNPDGGAADVYFYSRSDCWIIGATRQECRLGPEGNMSEESPVHDTIQIGGESVPHPMYVISRDILHETIGINIESLPMKARYGYRFIRKNMRLRLEKVAYGSKIVIHNYGHGGAGVTLSWGCAEKVVELALEQAGR